MDYPNRRRVKIWGRARLVEDDPALIDRLIEPGYAGRPERAILFTIEAWDVNCPQHITPRYSDDEILALVTPLNRRIAELEAEVGREEDAKKIVSEILSIDPDFSIKTYMAGLSYRDPAESARFEEGLRKAGLPE